MATVRARYEKGVLTPLEPLNLEEGKEVMVSVDAEIATDDADKSKMPSDSGESLLEMFSRLRESVPPEAWDGLPTDLTKNKKHYLYGHPREED